jgi:rSAM/selenodomain-associated transferase 2
MVKNNVGTLVDLVSVVISVVIPALNAGADLPATLATLGSARAEVAGVKALGAKALVAEVLVVDGGSTDATARIATASGASVITAARGRGAQLAAGVAAATQPWLLLLHADTRLAPGWADAAGGHMRTNQDRAAYFRFVLDSEDRRARRLERLVAWRCRVLALPYGDQGLLIHRDLLRAVGGVRPLPLMEDVELVRRLGRHRLVALEANAVTSAAKWRREGWYRRSARNLLCLSLYLAGVPPRLIARVY